MTMRWTPILIKDGAETDLLPTLRELGIALVGWSPLGSGFPYRHDHQPGRISGTHRPKRAEENTKAADIHLTPELLKRINELTRPGRAEGGTPVYHMASGASEEKS